MTKIALLLALLTSTAWATGEFKTPQGIVSQGSVSIGTANSPATNTLLDLIGTTKGGRPCPVMTDTQRNAISSPASGLCVMSSTSTRPSWYTGAAWSDLGDVLGAASSHANAAVVFSGTGGKLIQEATLTQHNMLVGGASNVFSSLAPGSNGNVTFSDGTDFLSNSTRIAAVSGGLQVNGNTTGDSNLGTISAVTMGAYYEGSFSVTCTGPFTAGQSVTVTYVKIGKKVTLQIGAKTAACSVASQPITCSSVPSGLAPAADTYSMNAWIDNNSALQTNPGITRVNGSNILIYRDGANNNYSATGNCGWNGTIPITYISST